jgi:hypothetical protein
MFSLGELHMLAPYFYLCVDPVSACQWVCKVIDCPGDHDGACLDAITSDYKSWTFPQGTASMTIEFPVPVFATALHLFQFGVRSVFTAVRSVEVWQSGRFVDVQAMEVFQTRLAGMRTLTFESPPTERVNRVRLTFDSADTISISRPALVGKDTSLSAPQTTTYNLELQFPPMTDFSSLAPSNTETAPESVAVTESFAITESDRDVVSDAEPTNYAFVTPVVVVVILVCLAGVGVAGFFAYRKRQQGDARAQAARVSQIVAGLGPTGEPEPEFAKQTTW